MSLRKGVSVEMGGRSLVVGMILGEGSQGRVWDLIDDIGQPRLAVKWYHSEQATSERRHHLRWLIDSGPPTTEFLWPVDLVTAAGVPGFGVALPLLPGPMRPLSDAVTWPESAGVQLALGLAAAVTALHLSGLCHRDLSAANVWIEPGSAEVRIIDNDTAGTPRQPSFGVRGTKATTLPEVAAGASPPDMANDRFALSVLIARLLGRNAAARPKISELLNRSETEAPEPLTWVLALRAG